NQKLAALRREQVGQLIENYTFQTIEGEVTLLDLFGDKDVLFAIHNMGQTCGYCTLWADGLNAFLHHLEDCISVVILSIYPPDMQRRFALSRCWRFRTASHGGGVYIREQTVLRGTRDSDSFPGMVV